MKQLEKKQTWPRGLIDILSQRSTSAFSYCLRRWEVNAVPTSVIARRHCPWWPNSIPTRLGPTVSRSTASSISEWRIELCPLLTATRAASWRSWASFAPDHPELQDHHLADQEQNLKWDHYNARKLWMNYLINPHLPLASEKSNLLESWEQKTSGLKMISYEQKGNKVEYQVNFGHN